MRYFTLVKINDRLKCRLCYENGFLRLAKDLMLEASVVQENALSDSVLWRKVRASFLDSLAVKLFCFLYVLLEATAFRPG